MTNQAVAGEGIPVAGRFQAYPIDKDRILGNNWHGGWLILDTATGAMRVAAWQFGGQVILGPEKQLP